MNCGGEPKLREVTKKGVNFPGYFIFFYFGAGHHHRVPEKATDQSVQQSEQLNLQMKLSLGPEEPRKGPLKARVLGKSQRKRT